MAQYTYQNLTNNPLHIGRTFFRPQESKSFSSSQPVLDAALGPTLDRYVDGVKKNTPFAPDESVSLSAASYIVAQNFAPRTRMSQNIAADATMMTIHSVTIPGGIMRENSTLAITPFWSHTNSASSKTLALYVDNQSGGSPAVTTSNVTRHLYQLHNANGLQSQKMVNASNGYASSNNPVLTYAIDTRRPFTIDFRTRWGAAVASEVICLEGFIIELLP